MSEETKFIKKISKDIFYYCLYGLLNFREVGFRGEKKVLISYYYIKRKILFSGKKRSSGYNKNRTHATKLDVTQEAQAMFL